MADLKVNIEKVISAPIEVVFDAWLNPKILPKFMMGMPDMPETVVEELDVHEGGSFTFIMDCQGEKLPHSGKYIKISRPDELVFTWVSQNSVVENSTVKLHFTRIDGNKTKISLSHVRFIDEESRSGHEGGWGCILDKLNEVIG
ncbi:SRPBCC domain-containing protein [Desulfopila sp. IMCC35006]|uniref:SRPBCC family protein n=1 Tax=Desulfopila sp. IMCC35006 TaxID=2569542 RepID=UPI0010AB8139|nr:SRPBCC domain-containing protein [Desulfopila sp. IMCC35006]TKB24711.1 SRPBCC domain-containing protein [Desulfopila sp. IMCC35006]